MAELLSLSLLLLTRESITISSSEADVEARGIGPLWTVN